MKVSNLECIGILVGKLITLFSGRVGIAQLVERHSCTMQEHQRIRTFAIYQTFLTLRFVLWAMEIFTFSSIQPI